MLSDNHYSFENSVETCSLFEDKDAASPLLMMDAFNMKDEPKNCLGCSEETKLVKRDASISDEDSDLCSSTDGRREFSLDFKMVHDVFQPSATKLEFVRKLVKKTKKGKAKTKIEITTGFARARVPIQPIHVFGAVKQEVPPAWLVPPFEENLSPLLLDNLSEICIEE